MLNQYTQNNIFSRAGVKTTCLAILMAGLAAPVSANAAIPNLDTVQITINADDLERERGVERVYTKLKKTAERACQTRGRQTLRTAELAASCSANLLNDFVSDLDDQRVTAFHNAKMRG